MPVATQNMRVGLPPFPTFPLINKETLVPADGEVLAVRRFTFGLPSGQALGFNLGLGDHLKVVVPGITKPRSYSPTSDPKREGSFDLTLKIYKNGRCSEWLDSLELGTFVRMFGKMPIGTKMQIYNPGPHVIVIALGIGITEGLPVMNAELRRDGGTASSVTLIYAVRYKREVIFTQEIQEEAAEFGGRVRVVHAVSQEAVQGDGWHSGRVDADLVKKCVGGAAVGDVRFLVVGTKGMKREVWGLLKELGFPHASHALLRKPMKPM